MDWNYSTATFDYFWTNNCFIFFKKFQAAFNYKVIQIYTIVHDTENMVFFKLSNPSKFVYHQNTPTLSLCSFSVPPFSYPLNSASRNSCSRADPLTMIGKWLNHKRLGQCIPVFENFGEEILLLRHVFKIDMYARRITSNKIAI